MRSALRQKALRTLQRLRPKMAENGQIVTE